MRSALCQSFKEVKMPIYEYRCRKCGMLFEMVQKVDEGGESLNCPSCGEGKPEKVISSFSSTKGSGCGTTGSTGFS